MTDKEVRRLRRIELLEILIDQKKEIEELRTRLEDARKQIERDDALIQRLMSSDIPHTAAPAFQAPAAGVSADPSPEPPSPAYAEPETFAPTAPVPAAPPVGVRGSYADEDEEDFIPMRGLSDPIPNTAWDDAEETADASAAAPQEGIAEPDESEDDSRTDPADEADSAEAADGTESVMTNEELDDYLQRLIKEEDA